MTTERSRRARMMLRYSRLATSLRSRFHGRVIGADGDEDVLPFHRVHHLELIQVRLVPVTNLLLADLEQMRLNQAAHVLCGDEAALLVAAQVFQRAALLDQQALEFL